MPMREEDPLIIWMNDCDCFCQQFFCGCQMDRIPPQNRLFLGTCTGVLFHICHKHRNPWALQDEERKEGKSE